MNDINRNNLLKDYLVRFPQKKEIASLIGIHWVTLSKFINGHHVGELTLMKIQEFLKTNFFDLERRC